MTKHEIKNEYYHCLQLKGQALLTFEYNIVDENNKILVRFDCSEKLNCGIAKKNSKGCSFDWDPCTPYSTLARKRFRI